MTQHGGLRANCFSQPAQRNPEATDQLQITNNRENTTEEFFPPRRKRVPERLGRPQDHAQGILQVYIVHILREHLGDMDSALPGMILVD